MLFKSNLVTQASGSLGGITASHNRSGLYLRARTIPVNPATGLQVALRAIFGSLSVRWQNITAVQRAAWETYAANVPVTNKLGDPINLTGQQMYIRNNTARVQAGFAEVDDGPTVFSQDSLSPVSVEPLDATSVLSVTFSAADAWPDEDDAGLLVFGSREKADTINFFKGPYQFAGSIDGDAITAPTSPTTVPSPFALTQDNVQFTRVVSVRADGRISPVQFIGPNTINA